MWEVSMINAKTLIDDYLFSGIWVGKTEILVRKVLCLREETNYPAI
jgi:hypothetical protein